MSTLTANQRRRWEREDPKAGQLRLVDQPQAEMEIRAVVDSTSCVSRRR